MRGRWRSLPAAGVTAAMLVVLGAAAASAAGPTGAFSGQCQFSGPITPMPPITVIPHPGSHFSYLGRGKCTGSLAGRAVSAAPLTIRFQNVSTLFDTCELGPDVRLHGTSTIGSGRRLVRFAITIDMVRAAVAGPFSLTSSLGGRALGVAEFTPASPVGSVQQCGGTGISTATLSGSFRTAQALVGAAERRSAGARRSNRHHS
jgi:hypothetical protein